MFKVKIALLGILLSTSMYAFALDEVSSIPESHQKVVQQIKEELGLKGADKAIDKKIYSQIDFALKDGWYSYWIGNRDLDKAKFKEDKVRIVDVMVPSNDRINNITFTYFPSAGQIFCTQRQFIEGSSSKALEAFRKAKEDSEMKKFNETDNYGFFQKKGSATFEIYHVKSPNAAVAYFDYSVIDVK